MTLNLRIKKWLAFFAFLLGICFSGFSQNGEARIVTVSQAKSANGGYYLQVGVPYLGITAAPNAVHTTTPSDVRFPWHILYLYNTFAEESFSVSKGYFTDKVIINWNIRSNQLSITGINVYRKKIGEASYGSSIASLGAFTTQYEDEYIEGGQLYEYKIEASGISNTPTLQNLYRRDWI